MTEAHASAAPVPVGLVVHKKSRRLEIAYDKDETFFLPFEFLRVYSPSAEVKGHGPGEEILQTGKRNVDVDAIEQVGNYGIQPRFSDGHQSGIFDWGYLYWLAANQEALWEDYLVRLEQAGHTRESGRDVPMSPARSRSTGCSRNAS